MCVLVVAIRRAMVMASDIDGHIITSSGHVRCFLFACSMQAVSESFRERMKLADGPSQSSWPEGDMNS